MESSGLPAILRKKGHLLVIGHEPRKKRSVVAAGKKLPVLIADDHQLILTGLRIVIGDSDGFYISGEARNGEEALEAVQKNVPRIVVLDIGMPPGATIQGQADSSLMEEMERIGIRDVSQYGGLLVVEYIKKNYPAMGILIVTQQESPAIISAASRLRVDGVLLKDDVNENIVAALDRIVSGHPVFSDKVNAILERHKDSEPKLSEREWQVFELVAHGFKDKEIAERLDISARTVAFHKGNLKEKLNAETTAELIAYFHERNR
ncbi:MAG: response regulator transcription factor [Leptospiraceae bacterium]|nr:response regulator transcription factor [Leptospiraceae bacterium]